MKTIADIEERRLEKVLIKDKSENPDKMQILLKSDLLKLLQNYMEISDLELDFNVSSDGYKLYVNAESKRLKTFGFLPK